MQRLDIESDPGGDGLIMEVLRILKEKYGLVDVRAHAHSPDQLYISVAREDFKKAILGLHTLLVSPIAMMFAQDHRRKDNTFKLSCVFMAPGLKKWFIVDTSLDGTNPEFESLSKEIYSAALFERELLEMFGITALGNPDPRRLRLHDEVWPQGHYPMRKDYCGACDGQKEEKSFIFNKVEGAGIFEVPVGPVHAGIIPPGHFRFSVAGEPIINLEIRLGFVHRGAEKLFEGKTAQEALILSERVAGDSAFANSLACAHALEKICGVVVPERAQLLRVVFLELERLYNHANDIGGIALDVGFSFPAAFAALMKEAILQTNDTLTGSRYLKGINSVGGLARDVGSQQLEALKARTPLFARDLHELKAMLFSSISFMDRVDGTGILKKKTAQDFGVVGLAARAAGIGYDLRSDFDSIYKKIGFTAQKQESGDVLARLNVRLDEFQESIGVIERSLAMLNAGPVSADNVVMQEGFALGFAESWRGPLLYWISLDGSGAIERGKIVDPSFHNWQGLAYCVLGDIIPDFPLCNKSFDLSYAGNDL